MHMKNDEYDPRYLKGIELFNAGAHFDAHEVWEELWKECDSGDRRFYQSLIHAAVAIYHAGRGNHTGASRLLGSGSRYAAAYPSPHRGFDHVPFWREMHAYIEFAFVSDGIVLNASTAPGISLVPSKNLDI